jgi:HlyD family secretion protein
VSLSPIAKPRGSKAAALISRSKSKAITERRERPPDIEGAIDAETVPRSGQWTIRLLALFVVAMLVVLTVAKVDHVVSSVSGKMVTMEPSTVLQALDTSIIKSIDVREGQRVEKGQLLATLDAAIAASAVNQLKAQIDSLRAQIARDQAEIAGGGLVFPPNDDPDYGKYQQVQRELFDQQMAQYAAQVNSFDQKIALAEMTINKYRTDEGRYREEGGIARQIEEMWTTLQIHGNGSLLSLLTATDTKLEALRTMDFDHNSVVENEHSLASLKADREAFIQQFLTTTNQDLVTQRNSLDTALAQLDAAIKHQDLVRLVAPEASIVLQIVKLSPGSVLQQGDSLMTLTPVRVPIEAEVQMSASDVGFLRPGDPASLKIDAFRYDQHGTARGKVRWISEDAFSTDDSGNPVSPYYKVRIIVTSVDLIDVPASFRLIPGMTLTADVKVQTRSLGLYVMGLMIQGAGDAMREP